MENYNRVSYWDSKHLKSNISLAKRILFLISFFVALTFINVKYILFILFEMRYVDGTKANPTSFYSILFIIMGMIIYISIMNGIMFHTETGKEIIYFFKNIFRKISNKLNCNYELKN
jgi:hypothetical protein